MYASIYGRQDISFYTYICIYNEFFIRVCVLKIKKNSNKYICMYIHQNSCM